MPNPEAMEKMFARAKERGAKEVIDDHPRGFVKWKERGEYIEGTLEHMWQAEYGPVATLVIRAIGVSVTDKDGNVVELGVGDRVNVGLTLTKLKNSVDEGDLGRIITYGYKADVPTKSGTNPMRDIRTYKREPIEQDRADDDGLPF